MTKRKPPEHSQFKPGQTGNPGGRPKLPDDIKAARKLNQVELERIVNKYLWLDASEVRALSKAPGTPMIELMVASIIEQAALKGDQMRLEFVLCRLIGKVQERIEVSTVAPFIIRRPSGETVELGAEKPKEVEAG